MCSTFKISLVIISTLCLAACGESDGVNFGNQKKNKDQQQEQIKPVVAQNLGGKSTEEVIKIKYNKLDLKCDLWIYSGEQFVKTDKPTDSKSIDLLNINSDLLEIKLSVKNEFQAAKVSVKINDIEIVHNQHTDQNGIITIMKYSPTLNISYMYDTIESTSNNSNIKSSGNGQTHVRERIINNFTGLLESQQGTNQKNYFTVECLLQSDIKPEYQDQYRTIKND